MKVKNERLDTLRFIISNFRVKTQQKLASYLREYGIVVNQSTLSRDLLQIRAYKDRKKDNCYSIFEAKQYVRVFEEPEKTEPEKVLIDDVLKKCERITEEIISIKKELQQLKEQENSAKD